MHRLPALAVVCALASCGPLPGEFGSSCAKDEDCKTGLCVAGLPGGYCTSACQPGGSCEGAASCAPAAGGNYCLQVCVIDFECREGYVCVEVGDQSVCRPRCAADSDCPAQGAVCGLDGRCTAGKEAVGAACQINSACEIGRCEGGFPGGYCTRTCTQAGEGTVGQDCPERSACARMGEATGMCLATCASAAGCRDGYLCDLDGAAGVCRPRCAGNADCGLGYSCDVAKGSCVEGGAAPRRTGASCGVGKSCTESDASACDADCDSGYCLTEQTEQFPKGFCSADCSAAGATCADRALCVGAGETDICLQRCTTNFDCRSEYFCRRLSNAEESVCIPRCTAVAMCDSATEECDLHSGACVLKGQSGQVRIIEQPLGSLSVAKATDSANATAEVAFEVPADAVSFALILEAPFGGNVSLFALSSPGGSELFNYNRMWTSAVRAFPGDSATAVLFPNSPRLSVEKGRYKARFVVFDTPGGSAKASVILKTASGPAVGSGTLDLNLWFVGTGSLNAQSAKSDAKFQEMLFEFWRIYAQSNISRGTVTYLDAPAEQAARLSTIDSTEGPDSELRELFKMSKGAPNKAMNFFFVKEIRDARDGGYITIGMAGGIPGVPVIQGTPTSGVAVSILDLQAAPKRMAALTAHEGAHWLGLFHVTESSGKLFDTLPDTAECPSSRDKNGNGMVDADECASLGKENTMFWVLTNNWDLTGNQSFVLLRSPAVR